jgi:fumarate reductase subunit D
MAKKKTIEPFLWSMFSAGGVAAAMFIPVLFVLFFFAFPLGWLAQPNFNEFLNLVKHPIARLFLFAVCSAPLFHWAHRFRFTLYDGLQIKHLNEFVAVLCYGGAIIGTIVAGYILLTI